MRFRRTLCLLTTILALTTAVALLGAGLALRSPGATAPRPVATEAVVHAFYDAVNTAIAAGDPADLDETVAEDLVTHGSLATLALGRAGLVRYLASLHATRPHLELAVEEVVTARNRALVHLSVRGGDDAHFLGSSPRGDLAAWGTVDALAVAGHRVVEYWGGATGLALLEPLGQAPYNIDAPSTRVVSLDRLLVPPGASFAARGAAEALLLFVEAGTVTVTSTPLTNPPPNQQAQQVAFMASPEDDTPAQTPPPLTAGDFLSPPAWSRTDIHNVDTDSASVLVLATEPLATPGAWASDPTRPDMRLPHRAGFGLPAWQAGIAQMSPSGAIVAPLTGIAMTRLAENQTAVAVGRVTLAPGATLAAFTAAGPHLLVVNEGIVDLATSGEPAWIYREAGRYLRAATLGTATGAMFHSGTAATLHNPDGKPVVVTVVAILPNSATTDAAT